MNMRFRFPGIFESRSTYPWAILEWNYRLVSFRHSKSSSKTTPSDTVDPLLHRTETNKQTRSKSPLDVMSLSRDTTKNPLTSPSSQSSSVEELSPDKLALLKRTWSPSMRPKEDAMKGPRFEHTIMEAQPFPKPAIDLVHQEPIVKTDQRIVYCDGGHGALGHPKVYINLDKPETSICGYCGKQFFKISEHHHESHS